MAALNRREWLQVTGSAVVCAVLPRLGVDADAALSAAQATPINSTFRGVTIGTQSYSFRDRTLDEAIAGMKEVGIGSCELWSAHLEPAELRWRRDLTPEARKEQAAKARAWRESVSLDHFREARAKFDKAGVALNALNYSFGLGMSDREIERGFEIAKAMGVTVITSSNGFDVLPRIIPVAKQHGIPVAVHNHSQIDDPNEIVAPGAFAKAVEMGGGAIKINLDIGHFVAANLDPLPMIEQHHAHIVTLHIKDRQKNQGENMPFGKGDTPIVPVLQLLRHRQWAIPANIEYEYGAAGMDTIAEMKTCLAYCRHALES